MKYIDGFLLPVPKKNLSAYRAMSKKAGKVWRAHGALEYFECALDDKNESAQFCAPFTKTVKIKSSETIVFAWILYKSKAHRNAVNKKVMKDPRMLAMMNETKMPFDVKKMMFGGFKVIVEA
jgi:uncharacterized protein YbaA (DUF1428 family)